MISICTINCNVISTQKIKHAYFKCLCNIFHLMEIRLGFIILKVGIGFLGNIQDFGKVFLREVFIESCFFFFSPNVIAQKYFLQKYIKNSFRKKGRKSVIFYCIFSICFSHFCRVIKKIFIFNPLKTK